MMTSTSTEHLAQYKVGAASYNRGCRCVGCTQANTEKCQRYQSTEEGRAYKLNWQREKAYRERPAIQPRRGRSPA